MKRFITLLLLMVTLFSLTPSVFAAEIEAEETEEIITSVETKSEEEDTQLEIVVEEANDALDTDLPEAVEETGKEDIAEVEESPAAEGESKKDAEDEDVEVEEKEVIVPSTESAPVEPSEVTDAYAKAPIDTAEQEDDGQKDPEDEEPEEPLNGWVEEDGNRYYYIDGVCLSDTVAWIDEEGAYYGFDNQGHMKTGWFKPAGYDSWYYFNDDGKGRNGWAEDSQGRYYCVDGCSNYYRNTVIWIEEDNARYGFNNTGLMVTNAWLRPEGSNEWYYFGSNGKGYKGWVKDGNNWYYCVDGYSRYYYGVTFIKGDYYFFDENGRMCTGWQYDSVYVDEDGKEHKAWYYFYS
ncbi:MAG: hypothetical protein Q4D71_03175, partial [Oscillospiraceae bacterium]|nr:hypothetical protein [Oscillospiraceae bacterium]